MQTSIDIYIYKETNKCNHFIMQTVGIKQNPPITNLNTLRTNNDKIALFYFSVEEKYQALLLTKVDRYITKSHHFVFVYEGAKIETFTVMD